MERDALGGRARWRAAWGLAAICVAAAVLRFWNIQHVGVFSMDEARYLLDAGAKRIEIGHLIEIVRLKLAERAGGAPFFLETYLPAMRDDLVAHAVFFPKTLFYYLAGALMLFTGFKIWVGAAVQSFFGVLSVWMLYFLVRRAHSARAGLIAAAMLAFSAYHVYFSRTAYTQCLPGFFVLLALTLHARWALGGGKARWIFAAGFAVGVGLWGAYQTLALAPALVLTHLYASALAPNWSARARRALWGFVAALGVATALLVAEAPTYPLILLFRAFGMDYPHATFLELNVPRWMYHTHLVTHWSGLAAFPYFLGRHEGFVGEIALVFAGGIGLIAAVVRLKIQGRLSDALRHPIVPYLVLPLLAPYLIFAIKAVLVMRAYVHVLPFLAGLLGVAIAEAWRVRNCALRATLVAALVIAAGSSLLRIVDNSRIRSAYPEIAREMIARGARLVPGSQSLIARCYLWEAGQAESPSATDAKAHPLWLTCDLQELSVGRYPDQIGLIPEGATPIAEFHQDINRTLLETEGLPPFAYDAPLWGVKWARGLDMDRAARILLYDLTDVPDDAPRIRVDIAPEITRNIPK